MIIQLNFIMGVNFGFEFIEDKEDKMTWLVLDFLVLRVLIGRV